tara:strand:- start:996 stop:2813 length:1818 start_codon:yes stop_codon:yes gene_type:complete
MAGYTRQSSYSDGDTITAAHSNDEFDQVLAAFNNSSGHKHDGTAAEGPVIGLIGDPGETTPLNKVVIDNPNNQIEFSVDVSSSSVEQLVIKDGVIEPTTDNDIDLGSSSKEFKDLYIDGTAHVDAINFNGTAITATAAELNIMDGVTSTAAELNILDGVTSTAAEINIIDGNTSATSTTLADADRVVVNDDGTMVQVALTDFETYFEGALDTLSNVTTVGALDSGSITSGFGNIDNGSSTITTTGLITGGSLDIDDVVINGSTIGHTDDTDLITVANGIATVAGELSVTTLDIGGTNVTSTAAELNILDGVTSTAAELNILDGVTSTAAELNILDGVTATTAEVNILDGDTSATSTTLADADRLIVNDNGTMKQVALSDFETFFESALDTTSNITTVGALDSGSITSGFGNIDNGSSTITTTGLITGGSLDIDDVVINGTTIGHTDDTDLMTVANGVLTVAGEVSMTTLDIGGTNVTSTAAELNILDGVTSTAAELNILDGVTSTASELNILDGVTATTAELNYSDTGAAVGTVVASKVVTVDANKDVSSFRNITLTGELDAGSLDISGDADIDGTLEADAITVNGTALNTVIADEATALAIALG